MITVSAWTVAKVGEFVFLGHLLDAGARDDVALVNEAVEELSARFDDGKIAGHARVSARGGVAPGGGGRVGEGGGVRLCARGFGAAGIFWLDVEDHLEKVK